MFRMSEMKRLLFPVFMVVVLVCTPAFAQNDDPYIQLTRISLIEGNVGYQRVPDEEWVAASVNMPLEPGDRIYTGNGGRVEVEFEEGSVMRLAESTDIEILALDEDFVHVRMLLGMVSITVEKNAAFEISTPAAAFSAEDDGIYRFEVAESGRGDAVARKGRLEAVNDNISRVIRTGELIRVYPGAMDAEIASYSRRDAWDEWTDRRDADRRPTSSVGRYIPDNVSIGVAELDRNGRWVYVTNYGWGWVPHSVTSNWAPYSVGRWVYRPRFGWTWVSYESWGWLPYHYGRWYRDSRVGWIWIPGDGVAFRFWSPGLVVFYRGSGWVSWGPLGPGDYYDVTYYRYRRIYAGDLVRVRALIARQPGNYINRNARGAFQTVSLDHFRGVLSGGPNARRNDINQPWRQGNLVRGGLDVNPLRESLRPAPDRRGERPREVMNRPVVVRRTPPQFSGSDGRFTPINRDRRPAGESNSKPSASKPASSSGNRQTETPGTGSSASPKRQNTDRGNSTDAPSRKPAGENSSKPSASKPASSSGDRQTETPGTGSSASKPASSSVNRQTETPDTGSSASPKRQNTDRGNNTDAPVRKPAGESSSKSSTSKPASSSGERQAGQKISTGNSTSSKSGNAVRPTRNGR